MYLLAVGTHTGGYEFIGPFKDSYEALEFAEEKLDYDGWELIPVTNPEEVDEI